MSLRRLWEGNKRTASPSSETRAKYDLRTASSIGGENGSNSECPEVTLGCCSSRLLTLNDIHVALDGIEKADGFVRDGRKNDDQPLRRAMNLYQLSIEVLIRAINHSKTNNNTSENNNHNNYWPSHEILAESAQVALTNAESLKLRLQNIDRVKPTNPKSLKKISPKPVSGLKSTNQSLDTNRKQRRTAHPPNASKKRDDDDLEQTVYNEMLVDLNFCTKTRWNDIAGLSRAKQSIQEAVILPLIRPDLYTGLRAAPHGILLYGPPGTGKTMIARAAAYESKSSFFACSAGSLTSKWVGDSEKTVKSLFRVAQQISPSIIFFDEIDSLLSKRKSDEHEASRRFKTEFMIQFDGVRPVGDKNDAASILVLGCSNCPWDLDDAVIRRFQRRIYVPLPDSEARKPLIKGLLEKSSGGSKNNTLHSLSKHQISQLVKSTEGYSCADIVTLCSDASFGPLRSIGGIDKIKKVSMDDVRAVNFEDFKEAIRNNKKSVSSSLLEHYAKWECDQQ